MHATPVLHFSCRMCGGLLKRTRLFPCFTFWLNRWLYICYRNKTAKTTAVLMYVCAQANAWDAIMLTFLQIYKYTLDLYHLTQTHLGNMTEKYPVQFKDPYENIMNKMLQFTCYLIINKLLCKWVYLQTHNRWRLWGVHKARNGHFQGSKNILKVSR